MLAVDGLFRDTERFGDVLPGPSAVTRSFDVKPLQSVEQSPERGDRPKPVTWVVGRRRGDQTRHLGHDVSIC